jgi:predicted DsbA family dithiol-disulfide isomerase
LSITATRTNNRGLRREVLENDAFTAEVRVDETNADELGINAVPFFVLEEQYGISGAQTSDVLLRALEQAAASSPEPYAEGAHCGPDGC